MPRSTPRVGSSRSTTSASVARARAITAFCWLPPLSDVMGVSPSLARTLSRSNQLAASSLLRLGREHPAWATLGRLDTAMFSSIDHSGKDALVHPVAGDERDRAVDGDPGSDASRWSKMARSTLPLPAAFQPGQPHDLATPDGPGRRRAA